MRRVMLVLVTLLAALVCVGAITPLRTHTTERATPLPSPPRLGASYVVEDRYEFPHSVAITRARYWHAVTVWVTGIVKLANYERWMTVAVQHEAQLAAARVIEQRRVQQQHVYIASSSPPSYATPSTYTGSMSGVMACIKNAESGNYSESSHTGSGSGAYQFIPSTWRTYSASAGHGGYAYAYQAPAAVQDAVTEYALTHGGAGNWSNRWGRDGCTAGLPGGG